MNKPTTGFTLIELAIVLAVVGLVIGGLLIPLGTQIEQHKIRETQKALDEIKEALVGYALSHVAVDGKPYLPCPDTDGDGLEDARSVTTGDCPSFEGRVPRATLGTARTDGWGRQFRYRVERLFSNNQTGFVLNTSPSPTLRVCSSSASCSTTVIASGLPAVIVSHGKNGYGARDDQSNVVAVPAAVSTDELENINGRNNPGAGNSNPDTADSAAASRLDFVSRIQTESGTVSDEFDDLVTWLSPNILFNRMVAAGKLP
jgi:prepilin-type N-terminal cleavage/methylation domain-containing protein